MKKLCILFILVTAVFLNAADVTGDDAVENKYRVLFKQKMIEHEKNNPFFAQKSGMLGSLQHLFYLRTNDEWTGFSTFYLGYRYGVSDYFNIAAEFGFSAIPWVILGELHLHFKIWESKNRVVFFGGRLHLGYKYQDSDFSTEMWRQVVGPNYLTLKNQVIFIIPDFTLAFRFGNMRQFALYHTIFPKFEVDILTGDGDIYFSPGMLGFEVRWGSRMEWNFAIEAGYTFPLPWNSVPAGKWVNFPSLANINFSYRFGDSFYSKANREKIRKEAEILVKETNP